MTNFRVRAVETVWFSVEINEDRAAFEKANLLAEDGKIPDIKEILGRLEGVVPGSISISENKSEDGEDSLIHLSIFNSAETNHVRNTVELTVTNYLNLGHYGMEFVSRNPGVANKILFARENLIAFQTSDDVNRERLSVIGWENEPRKNLQMRSSELHHLSRALTTKGGKKARIVLGQSIREAERRQKKLDEPERVDPAAPRMF